MRSSAQPFFSATPSFSVVVADCGTTRTVTLTGELDIASVPEARLAVDAALAEGFETVVLDLGQTTFMDTTGVHLVHDASAHAQQRAARFIVLPGPPAVQRVFELCGFAGTLPSRSDSDRNGG